MINLTGIFTALVFFLWPSATPTHLSKSSTNLYFTGKSGDLVKPPVDTLVNYCRLVRSAFFYGQKSTEKKPFIDPADLEFFNDNWKEVFDVPVYQIGIGSDEFTTVKRFREGNKQIFPPSVRYDPKNPDTYLLFHIAKEIGEIMSPAYDQCPTCIQESIDKINELLKETSLHAQVSQLWLGTNVLKKITSVQEVIDFWLLLRCLTIDDRANPVLQPLLISLPPVVKCPDTTIIKCKDEIKPKVRVGYRHCEIGGKVDTIGPMLMKGIDNCPGTVYAFKFTATDQCFLTATAWQYFRIENDSPALRAPADTMLDCIEHLVIHHPKKFTSCSLPARITTYGPLLVVGQHNCPYSGYEMEYTIKDTCGREEKYIQRITIQNDPPKIECPPDTVIECSKYIHKRSVKYTVSCFRWAEVTTTGPTLVKGFPDCDGSVYEMTYTVKDSCDRTASCTRKFTIRNKGPEIDCPQNKEVLCEDNIWVEIPKSVKVSCDLNYKVTSTDPVLTYGKKNCTGAIYSVTFTVTDECGRTDACVQLFTILQPELSIDCPPDQIVTCYENIKPAQALIKKACEGHYKVTTSVPTLVSGKGNCPGSKYSIIYTVADECGFVKECTQLFTIDNPAPEIVCYPDMVVECDVPPDYIPPVPAVSCDLDYDFVATEPELISGEDNCDGAVYRVIYTVTDECGRSVQCTQRFTLHIPLPQIKCEPDKVVECEDEIIPTWPQVKAFCDQQYKRSNSGAELVKGIEGCPGAQYLITYTVTDDCNRTVTCSQRFTIDNDPPTLRCPPDRVVHCEKDIKEETPEAFSPCEENTVYFDGPELVSGVRNCPDAVYEIKYWVEDNCERYAECIQKFKLTGDPLQVKCPQDTTVRLRSDIHSSSVYPVTGCNIKAAVSNSPPILVSGVYDQPGAIYEITYAIIDDCNHKETCVQRFKVMDVPNCASMFPNTQPVWSDQTGKYECYCKPGYVWNSNRTGCELEVPDCESFYPNSHPVLNTQLNKYECYCNTGYEWNAGRTECIISVPDCPSFYPNSYAVLNSQSNVYECHCLEGYEWNAARTACDLKIPDCPSYYPNSYAVLNTQTNKYECYCLKGYEWNTTRTACVLSVPDCPSYYPNSYAVLNTQTNLYECYCLTGFEWNATRTACVLSAPDCNSYYPNTIAVWNATSNKYECNCLQGYVWNAMRTGCELAAPDCNSYYPNTIAVWNATSNKYECNCLQGYVWNAMRTGCELAAPDCNSYYPNTIARFNYATNVYECICLIGFEWNATHTGCIGSRPDCSSYFPNSTAQWNAQTNKWECFCNAGYEWNATRTACIVSANRDNPPVNPQQQKTGQCNVTYGSGANEPEQYTIDVHAVTGTLQFTFNTYSVKDRIHIYYGNSKIFDSGCVGTSGGQQFTLDGYNNVFRIVVDPLCDPTESDTQWNFTLGCPN